MNACNDPIIPLLLYGILFLLAALVLAILALVYQGLGTLARFKQILANLQAATTMSAMEPITAAIALAIKPIVDHLVGWILRRIGANPSPPA